LVVTPLLKQKACDGRPHEALSIPLRMVVDAMPDGVAKVFGHLVFHTHVDGHHVWCFVQQGDIGGVGSIRPQRERRCQND